MPPIPNPWTDEMRSLVRALRYQDNPWSFREIAKHICETFGVVVTRNACIGMLRRMSLTVVLPPAPQWLPVAPLPPAPPKPKPPRPAFQTTIYQLTDKTCRWPQGENAPFMYCGCRPVRGSPYCAEHTRISYPNRDKHA